MLRMLIVCYLGLCSLPLQAQSTLKVSPDSAHWNILDYYQALPDSILKIPLNERLEAYEGMVLLNTPEIDTFYEGHFLVEKVDTQAGYLQVNTYPGDGDGTHYELKLYQRTGKGALLLVNVSPWAMCCMNSYLSFYKLEEGQWKNVTHTVWPSLSYYDYIPDSSIMHLLDTTMKTRGYNGPILYYKLYSDSTSIKAFLSETYFHAVYEEKEFGELTEELYELIKEKTEWIELELAWEQEHFVIRNKRPILKE